MSAIVSLFAVRTDEISSFADAILREESSEVRVSTFWYCDWDDADCAPSGFDCCCCFRPDLVRGRVVSAAIVAVPVEVEYEIAIVPSFLCWLLLLLLLRVGSDSRALFLFGVDDWEENGRVNVVSCGAW